MNDPLAHASATPDVAALITEFTYALDNGPARFANFTAAQAVRYNWWNGKSPDHDGLLHQAHQPEGKVVREGAPDTEPNLCDELIEHHVDMEYFARKMARLGANSTHVTGLTAAASAELTAVARWCRTAVKRDLRHGGELLSQMKWSIGWAVLHTGWHEKWGLIQRTLTMDEVFAASNAVYAQWQKRAWMADEQALPPLVSLPGYIADETLEDQAVETLSPFVPHLKQAKVRKIVRELRTEGEATFLDRKEEFKGPCLEILIPGVNVFVLGSAGDGQKARGWLIIRFAYEAQIRAMAVNGPWHEEFIEAVLGTAGMSSSRGESLRQTDSGGTFAKPMEIWTSYVEQYDDDLQTTGIYCTTFSPHLSPQRSEGRDQRSEKAYYGEHYLHAAAHGQYPFVVDRAEVIGPDLDDTRGIPRKVRADTNQMKLHTDALGRRAQWDTNPAIIKTGSGWSKIKEPLAPGGDLTAGPGCDAKAFSLDRGNPQVGANFIDRIEKSARRRFALPNNGQEGDHPILWQMRQTRVTDRSLAAYEDAFLQLAILCYQNFSPEELGQIIGHPPRLNVSDLLRCQVELTFDSRALDNDWRKETMAAVLQLLSIDNGGLMDRAPLLRILLSMWDTTLIDEVMRSPAGAQAALYRKVEQDVTSILLGNPPPLVEMDASAGMQLQMAFAVIGKNPKYQKLIASDPQAQENLKTYVENLQHSQQETELSPVQGRLGVAEMPQKPVTKGNALATTGQ